MKKVLRLSMLVGSLALVYSFPVTTYAIDSCESLSAHTCTDLGNSVTCQKSSGATGICVCDPRLHKWLCG